MTDPAPPARTTLNAEGVYPNGMLDFMEARCPSAVAHGNAEGTWKVDCAPCFAEFIRAARAEGRLAGLEEAAQLCLDEPTRLPFAKVKDDHPESGNYMHYADLIVRLDRLAGAIRRLAADGPKAPQDPKTPEIPAGKQG